MARPREINIQDVIKEFDVYVDETEYPMVKEFALNYRISTSRLYDLIKENDELSDTKKRCLTKAEIYLNKKLAEGKTNPTGKIFLLKQPAFGYTDKQAIDHSGGMVIIDESNIKD